MGGNGKPSTILTTPLIPSLIRRGQRGGGEFDIIIRAKRLKESGLP